MLRPNGRVLIRSNFADHMPDLLWHHFFPRAFEEEGFAALDVVVPTEITPQPVEGTCDGLILG